MLGSGVDALIGTFKLIDFIRCKLPGFLNVTQITEKRVTVWHGQLGNDRNVRNKEPQNRQTHSKDINLTMGSKKRCRIPNHSKHVAQRRGTSENAGRTEPTPAGVELGGSKDRGVEAEV